jgi:hypothetical protein
MLFRAFTRVERARLRALDFFSVAVHIGGWRDGSLRELVKIKRIGLERRSGRSGCSLVLRNR